MIIDFLWLSLFVGIGVFFEKESLFFSQISFSHRYYCRVYLLLLGPEILNIIHLDNERLGSLVYHLMAVGFIAIAEKGNIPSKKILSIQVFILSAFMWFRELLVLISLFGKYFFPDLVPAFWLIIAIGVWPGTGSAYAIGKPSGRKLVFSGRKHWSFNCYHRFSLGLYCRSYLYELL